MTVDPIGRPGDYNMAADAALLDRAIGSGGAFLRLYRWNPPTLSIGRNQQLDGDYGVPVVRRPTGGKAVWHEDELTYAVAAPISLFGSLRDAYCEIHTRLATALRSLGIDATLAPYRPVVRPSEGPTSCFAAPVGGEILVAGRKLVGSAQVRRGDAFLQHGSILLNGQQPGAPGGTTVAAVVGRPLPFGVVVAAIVRTWPDRLVRSDSPIVRPEFASAAQR
ncbi:MAG TPA: hypothetical protein VIV83_10595 [Gemmatimonadales bacterium]